MSKSDALLQRLFSLLYVADLLVVLLAGRELGRGSDEREPGEDYPMRFLAVVHCLVSFLTHWLLSLTPEGGGKGGSGGVSGSRFSLLLRFLALLASIFFMANSAQQGALFAGMMAVCVHVLAGALISNIPGSVSEIEVGAEGASDELLADTTGTDGRTKDSKHRNRAHIPADEATAGSALELKGQKAAASSQAQAQAKGTTTTWYVYADYDTTYADSEGTLDPNFGANALTDPVFLESLQTEIRQSTGKSTLTVPENQPGGIEPEQELVVPPTPEVKLVTTGSVLTAMFLGLQLMTLFVLYHIYQEKLMREFGPADKPVNVLPLSSSSSSESDDDDDDDDDSDSSSD
eukprot:g2166.t1